MKVQEAPRQLEDLITCISHLPSPLTPRRIQDLPTAADLVRVPFQSPCFRRISWTRRKGKNQSCWPLYWKRYSSLSRGTVPPRMPRRFDPGRMRSPRRQDDFAGKRPESSSSKVSLTSNISSTIICLMCVLNHSLLNLSTFVLKKQLGIGTINGKPVSLPTNRK